MAWGDAALIGRAVGSVSYEAREAIGAAVGAIRGPPSLAEGPLPLWIGNAGSVHRRAARACDARTRAWLPSPRWTRRQHDHGALGGTGRPPGPPQYLFPGRVQYSESI